MALKTLYRGKEEGTLIIPGDISDEIFTDGVTVGTILGFPDGEELQVTDRIVCLKAKVIKPRNPRAQVHSSQLLGQKRWIFVVLYIVVMVLAAIYSGRILR